MYARNWIAAAAVIATAAVGVWAQESATLTLKSTTRVEGQLLDLNASGFTIRVNGQERQIPKSDVAMIDFGDGAVNRPSELNDMREGQHVVLLRSGQVVAGEFVDVGGTQPLRLSFLTNSGPRDFSSSDVRRIYLSRPAEETPAAAPAPAGSRAIVVSSRQPWTETGIQVRQGETLTFDVQGEIEFDTAGAKATAGRNSNGAFDKNMPVPTAPTATLVARILASGTPVQRVNASRAFPIGDQKNVVMPTSGVLVLGINDTGFGDNRGEFRVTITGGSR